MDVNLILFFSNSIIFFIINVYSDESQTALKYLKDIEINIKNVLIMIEEFNIRDSNWNSLYSYYLTHSNILIEVADSFDLKLFFPVN